MFIVTLKKFSSGQHRLINKESKTRPEKYKIMSDTESKTAARASKLIREGKSINILSPGLKDPAKVAQSKAKNMVKDIEKSIKKAD